MRSKEEAHGYRYFPGPDLLLLEFDQAFVDGLAAHLPGTAGREEGAVYRRLWAHSLLMPGCWWPSWRTTADYFEEAAKGRDAKAAANFLINQLFGRRDKEGKDIASSPVSAAQLNARPRPDRRWRHLRQDRQGAVRDRLHRRRRPPLPSS